MAYGRVVIGMLVLAGTWTGTAVAEPAAKTAAFPLRSVNRFEMDATTATGLWVEAGGAITNQADYDYSNGTKTSTSVVSSIGRIAYGTKYLEGGVNFPTVSVDTTVKVNGVCQSKDSADGFGDASVYVKAVPLRTEYLDTGVGFELFMPTGDDKRGLGAGELGKLWFVSGALKLGESRLQAHFGHREYDLPCSVLSTTAPDSFWYGGGIIYPMNDTMAVRGEFVGEMVETPGVDANVLSFQPGLDLRRQYKHFDLLVRPTGLITMEDGPDWGAGGTFALSWRE